MMPLIAGSVIGRWTLLTRVVDNGRTKWACACACGTQKLVLDQNLKNGESTSCGCYLREVNAALRTTHGKSQEKVYRVWAALLSRCSNPNDPNYYNYGARGISFDPRWRSFEVFYAEMGTPPVGMSIERIDNSGPYSKDNCRWATLAEQARNKRSTRLISHNGVTRCASDWAPVIGLSRAGFMARLRRGLTGAELFGPPLLRRKRKSETP